MKPSVAAGLVLLGIAAARWRAAESTGPVFARSDAGPSASRRAAELPRPSHTVLVVMENHSYAEIIGSPSAPYINSLRLAGASFTDSHAVAHPSEPNYLALFAGTTENLSDDSCPHAYSDPNLASELAAAGRTFAGYSESMPSNGYTGCDSGDYARKHNPWVNFSNVSPSSNRTFGAFPGDFDLLPTVAFVVPNLCNDMHDCSIATGDAWLRSRMDAYVQWARTHDALIVVTFDESDSSSPTNQIATIFVGPMVSAGDYGVRIDHYSVLRTLDELYGIAPTGNAASASPITAIFAAPTPTSTPTATPSEIPTPDPRLAFPPSPGARRPMVVPFRTPT